MCERLTAVGHEDVLFFIDSRREDACLEDLVKPVQVLLLLEELKKGRSELAFAVLFIQVLRIHLDQAESLAR